MTTFGGHTVPPLFGGGGGGGGFGGYIFNSFSSLSFGQGGGQSNASRTLAVSASVGDLLVAFACTGPGYAGQTSVTLRTPTFAAWSTTGGVLNFAPTVSRFVSHIAPRFATGTAQDNCLIFGSGVGVGFPLYLGVAVFSGSIFGGTLAAITSSSESTQNLANVGSMPREVGQPGGAAITLRCWLGGKQTTAAESLVSVSNTDQSIIALDLLNVGDNTFNQGMIVAAGYKFEEFAVGTPAGVWPFSASWSGDVYSSEATFRSGDS